jgi:hypothetical protein
MMTSALKWRYFVAADAPPFRATAFATITIGADDHAISLHQCGRVKLAAASASGEPQWSFPFVL